MRERTLAFCAAAALLSNVAMAQPSRVDGGAASPNSVDAASPQIPATVNPQDFSCADLKARLASAGSLTILVGPRGYGDTFYGPRAPQCQFWQRPTFSYVRTRDTLCGVGYICVEKMGAAGGGR